MFRDQQLFQNYSFLYFPSTLSLHHGFFHITLLELILHISLLNYDLLVSRDTFFVLCMIWSTILYKLAVQ